MSTSCTVAVLGLLAAILNFGRAIIARVSRPSARQRAAKAAHEARVASAQGDTQAVNSITERHRLDNVLPVILATAVTCFYGCSLPRPVLTAVGTGDITTWRIGVAWGQPAAPEIADDAFAHGSGASCGVGGCSEK